MKSKAVDASTAIKSAYGDWATLQVNTMLVVTMDGKHHYVNSLSYQRMRLGLTNGHLGNINNCQKVELTPFTNRISKYIQHVIQEYVGSSEELEARGLVSIWQGIKSGMSGLYTTSQQSYANEEFDRQLKDCLTQSRANLV